jgi:hypothetical protein
LADVETVTAEVRALEGLDLEGLRTAWRRRYGAPPTLRSVELLRLFLAWRIQAGALGGLDQDTRRRLRGATAASSADHPGAGSRIVREWRGQTYSVDCIEDGYRWQGETYPSLSRVAEAITGVKRNGPKFFGLRESGQGT